MSAGLDAFIGEVEGVLARTGDEYEITERVAERLAVLLGSDYRLPEELTRPSEEHHVNYPLYIAPDDAWSLAVVVWNLGQRTPVHGHETWGVVGIYEGAERETRYLKPSGDEVGVPLKSLGDQVFERGAVTVCCTTDDDVHSVAAAGDVPTVGIHVYGGNIGTIERRRYEPETGDVRWFVSGWNEVPSR